MLRIAAGDRGAFKDLLRRYQERILNLLYRMIHDWDTALDLAQEVFIKVHNRATTFDPRGNARAWLITIAVNAARDHLRKKPRIVYLENFEACAAVSHRFESAHGPLTPPEILAREETRKQVHVAVGRMQEFQRIVLLLRDFEGLSYEEIAEVLGCEIGTVKSRIHRARKQFEEIFQGLASGAGEECLA